MKPNNQNQSNLDLNNKSTSHNTDDDEEEHSGPEKSLPKIYSAVNSVSSQDSGINLSFHDSDRSVDSLIPELGRSSSAESSSNSCCGGRRPKLGVAVPTNLGLCNNSNKKVQRPNDDLSEDDEIFFTATQNTDVSGEGTSEEKSGQDGNTGPWHCPPKNVWKPTVEAMQEFNMIRDNDKVLLCLTPGGVSSLGLLHTLHQYQFYARSKGIDFEIGVASASDGNYVSEIEDHLKLLDVPYLYEELEKKSVVKNSQDTITITDKPNVNKMPVSCTSFCEKITRAKLYALAKSNNYNVLALGQNLDDLTEGFLGEFFSNGKLKTMKAHYYIRGQDLRVIRPFVYVREKALKQFADGKKLPIHRSNETVSILLFFLLI